MIKFRWQECQAAGSGGVAMENVSYQPRALPAGINGAELDTAVVPAPQRADFWSEESYEAYHPLDIRTDAKERFSATLSGASRRFTTVRNSQKLFRDRSGSAKGTV